jgi:cobalt-precorrin-5B (C1)-methyltransferase
MIHEEKSMTGLKKGYTTGSCAQAAAKAATLMLLGRRGVNEVELETPSGVKLLLPVIDTELGDHYARCGVVKDSGDDPDVTHGARIYATVRFSDTPGVTLRGGNGVGLVTKPGLAVPVGEHAINPVPRRMILREVSSLLPDGQGVEVTITVPEGEALAEKTFNPRLGIEGGISIIGTTGIVEPKSIDAYRTSLSLELDVLRAQGLEKVTLVLGYVGERFCRNVLHPPEDSVIKIGDHVGYMLDQCGEKGFKEVLLVGHIGKLVKIAGGQFNTHFRFGDRRIETIVHHARRRGAAQELIEAILRETAAEATVDLLREYGMMNVFDGIAREVASRVKRRVGEKFKTRCILLSLKGDVLASHGE